MAINFGEKLTLLNEKVCDQGKQKTISWENIWQIGGF